MTCSRCGSIHGHMEFCRRQAPTKAALRIERDELVRVMRKIHRLLQKDLGGWYVSAPEGEPLGQIRIEVSRWL